MTNEIKNRIDQIRNGEVPSGYKKTKMGIVPMEWEDVKFDTLFDEFSEYTSNTEKYPLYSLTIENGVTAKTDRYERSHLVKKENSYKIIKPNYFAFNPMNVRFGAVARHVGNNNVSVSGYYDIFTTKLESDLKFMDNYLVSDKMIAYYNKVSTGSIIEKQRVHFSQFLDFHLPLPKNIERLKIAEILTMQDELIATEESLINKKIIYRDALLKKMISGEIRVNGFTEAWTNVKFKDVSIYKSSNLSLSSILDNNWNGGYCVYDASGIIGGLDSYQNDSEYISIIKDGSGVGRLRCCDKNTSVISTMGCISSNALANTKYLYYLLSTFNFNKYITGSTIPHIYYSSYGNEKIILPPIEEQNAIAEILSTADREIELLEQDLAQEKLKKKALMQLLLTGIVRVV